MRTPMVVFAEYRAQMMEVRALMQEWTGTADALRRIELEALIAACREVSDALMTEYRDACAARAEELKAWRLVR